MSWSQQAPDPRTPEQILDDRQRARIRASLPRGWESHYNHLTYGIPGGDREYGICGHDHICLWSGYGWRHPYPVNPPACNFPPTVRHSDLWGTPYRPVNPNPANLPEP